MDKVLPTLDLQVEWASNCAIPVAGLRVSARKGVMNNSTANRRSPLGLFPDQPIPRLYDRMVEVLRTRHYSRRTEEAYVRS